MVYHFGGHFSFFFFLSAALEGFVCLFVFVFLILQYSSFAGVFVCFVSLFVIMCLYLIMVSF